MKTIYLAGGCFWGTEHYIRQFQGVIDTAVGYANGSMEKPDYAEGGLLYELMLENKARNDHFSYSIWDMILFEATLKEKNLTVYLNTVMYDCETEDDKIEAKIGTVADGKTVVAMIGDVSTSVTSLKDTEVKANHDAIAKLNAADTEAGSVANTAKTTVEGYAIPKPNANCANEKCVLSVDREGNPYWMELALSL